MGINEVNPCKRAHVAIILFLFSHSILYTYCIDLPHLIEILLLYFYSKYLKPLYIPHGHTRTVLTVTPTPLFL